MSRKQLRFRIIILSAVFLLIILPISATIGFHRLAARLLMFSELAFFAGYILYLWTRTTKMKNVLDVSTEEEFEAVKQSCSYNHKNRLYISDDWVINTYSMKVYPLSDICAVSTSDSYAPKSGSKYYVKVSLSGGRDSFYLSTRSERDRLASALREYHANGGTPLVSDEVVSILTERGAGKELNAALQNIRNKNNGGRP